MNLLGHIAHALDRELEVVLPLSRGRVSRGRKT
jgi:hypothetical protein